MPVGGDQHAAAMAEPFLGSDAVASGALTRHALRTRYVAIHHDVYIAKNAELTATVRAKAAWLRCRGHGVIAGFSASALHGARWVDHARPATVIDTNRRRTRGVEVWATAVTDEEICRIDGIAVTTPQRTAVDLARRYPLGTAVAAVDALARATRMPAADLHAAIDRHQGRAGIRRARHALALVDPRAESPKETWMRLAVMRAGFPRPDAQVAVYNEYGVLIGFVDIGWPDLKIAVEYEGRHHRLSRDAFAKDIRRFDEMIEQGWIIMRITASDTEATMLRRLDAAWARRAAA
jgi:hypothetical protein